MSDDMSPDLGVLGLSAEELLTTTRSVRRRLDFERPVPRQVLAECVRLALQAPSGSNRWALQFVIVTDAHRRERLGEVYRLGYEQYRASDGYLGKLDKGSAARNVQQARTAGSADFLAENLERAPALVLACCEARADHAPAAMTAMLASVMPGMWSFMLAARLHGLGTCWTTVGMLREAELAAAVEIPVERATIACLTPVAYTRGLDFRPAMRPDPSEVIHWDHW